MELKARNQKGFATEIANPFIYKISWGKILYILYTIEL